MKASQVASASTAELLSFFNLNTGGAQVKKFADRKTAERRVLALIAEMLEENPAHQLNIDAAYKELNARQAEGEDMSGHTVDPLTYNIVKVAKSDVADNRSLDVEHHLKQSMTLEKSNPTPSESYTNTVYKLNSRSEVSAPTSKRAAMSDSLKLCRIITCLETGESWPNAFRMWKENPSWMTSAQVDRLTGVLYAAAKQPTPVAAVVTINGRSFKLAQI